MNMSANSLSHLAFQFPNGFSLYLFMVMRLCIHLNFQFPNGFSQMKVWLPIHTSLLNSFNSLTDSHNNKCTFCSIYSISFFQFPNGFSQEVIMMFKIKSDVFFQFPNGFSQDKDKDKDKADIDFQFPNGFSHPLVVYTHIIQHKHFQFPNGFSPY